MPFPEKLRLFAQLIGMNNGKLCIFELCTITKMEISPPSLDFSRWLQQFSFKLWCFMSRRNLILKSQDNSVASPYWSVLTWLVCSNLFLQETRHNSSFFKIPLSITVFRHSLKTIKHFAARINRKLCSHLHFLLIFCDVSQILTV
jgi:hypothetical protein